MFGSNRILAIDIGASSIRMAQFSALRGGGVELVSFAVETLDPEAASDENRNAYLTVALKSMMAERGIRPGPVSISVSGQSVFSRFVKLPPVSRDKILKMVQYEAQQNVPFPINEVVWDYQLIGGAEGEIDVMLAAIKADMIEGLADAVTEAGLEPMLIDVAPMALYNAVRYNYSDLPACTLVIDIGARSTDLVFIEEGRVFSRSIPVGGNTITQQIVKEFDLPFEEAEEMKKAQAFVSFGGAYESPGSEVADKVSKSVRSVMTRLHAEINRSINFYRTQQAGAQPGLILLTGGSSAIPYTDAFLRDKLNVEVDYLNPFQNVAVHGSIDAEQIGASAHYLGEVVGLALRHILTCPIEINLMPARVEKQRALRKKTPLYLATGAVLVLVLLVWCGYFYKLTQLGRERLEQVERKVRALQQVESRMETIERETADTRRKLETLLALPDKRDAWLEMLDDIHQRIPDGMWLTHVGEAEPESDTPDRGREMREFGENAEETDVAVRALELRGLAWRDKHPNARSIREFRDRLRESDLFSEKTEIQWLPSPAQEDVLLEFRIRAELNEPLSL
jgi:type IV pilus assembly protein PilM